MDTVDLDDARTFGAESFEKHGCFETDRMFTDVYCFEPGQSQSPHTHDDGDKVYVVLEGEGTFVVGEEERVLAEGDAVLAPAGKRHGVRNAANERLRTLVFMSWDHAPDGSANDA